MAYQLTPQAEQDLEEIWHFGAQTWSENQADKYLDELVSVFELISIMPNLAPLRHNFEPPVHIHVHHQHVIIYNLVGENIVIIRILGGKQNWPVLLKELDF
ncbi:type II toxin-antitoxin system RelE/ParE family toxin [Bartonella sp. HY406]|uniref:type II toxin-antitoxin system RelE/ParE family toxin n=1 Tax=Bartonella sp. HY406 TaxID=2979331 RepID=UPI0021C880EB|nr:type II toxin-antitoxin system RelE/ParE family toxin [Bartonella sp. HY406]UXN05029.1 type II toxin-antitoxin system RelE/ParE family toxin [Bartonella sp. HY406]